MITFNEWLQKQDESWFGMGPSSSELSNWIMKANNEKIQEWLSGMQGSREAKAYMGNLKKQLNPEAWAKIEQIMGMGASPLAAAAKPIY